MPNGARKSEWLSVRRSMAVLRRLLRGPADRDELIQAVLAEEGPDAYPSGDAARLAAFRRDCDNLRSRLEAHFTYDFHANRYELQDPGPFGTIELGPAELQALRLLSETFQGAIGEQSQVQALLDTLVGRLSPEARRQLEGRSHPLALDGFEIIDGESIAEPVWARVEQAVSERRQLAFNYLSPRHPERRPRLHRVDPGRIRYRAGHWYLYAYDLEVQDPDGLEVFRPGYRRFRLSRIQPDEALQVSPKKLAQSSRRPPQAALHYLLLPELGRGSASRHFDQMRWESHPDGSLEVWAVTDDPWDAARILLSYGENCIVLGGPEVLARLRAAVQGLARNYHLLDE